MAGKAIRVAQGTRIGSGLEQDVIAIKREGADIRLTWTTAGGHNYIVQTNAPPPSGSYTNNFSDLTTISMPSIGESTTNHLHLGAATNSPTQFYRIKLAL